MPEPEFEREVRLKMNELKFSPPDSVWTNVETQLKKDKEQKKPVFWIFFTLGLLLIGALGFIFFKKTPNTEYSNTNKNSQRPSLEKPKSPDPNRVNAHQNESLKAAYPGQKQQVTVRESHSNKTRRGSTEAPVSFNEARAFNKKKNSSDHLTKVPSAEHDALMDAIAEEQLTTNSAANEKNLAEASTPDTRLLDHPDSTWPLQSAQPLSKTEVANAKTAKNEQVQAKTTEIGKKHPWKLGFALAPGISELQSSPASHLSFSPLAISPASYVSTPIFSSAYYTDVHTDPGFSFAAGLFVQKYLAQKVYFTTGLNYHYYSYGLQINRSQINSAAYVSVTTVNHTNAFHFLELPIAIGFHLNQNKKLSYRPEIGFSFSQLIQSDVYTFDNQAVNHSQVNINAAFLVDIQNRKIPFFVGPVFQGALSNLFSPVSGGGDHLYFFGLRMGVLLKK